ncbi:hypothetical protein ASC94_31215 [Massilia sp. Root418]|jgi:type I restriction enzyme S subunit|uniref:restriction endonuclease subunit S n=1 Tax=Massilia sp. Root418 TaxID=1736532 RepID=UPI0006F4F86D|nr:restriction endonuclease subunit S [Massilia sp. Root418]KQW98765.1 hypothetical protein ASC94_31215 [Massilia sp. Root418]
MSGAIVRLRDVVEINPGMRVGDVLEKEVCFVAMADVSEAGRITNFQTRPLLEVSKGYTSFCQGDVLLAKITPCFENGKAAVVDRLASSVGFGSTEFHVLRPSDEINGRFLFHLIWNPLFRRLGAKRMTGSAGQKRVPTAFLAEYEFQLPPLAEQKRIATILDKADGLRRKRLKAIRLADEFLRAVFIDMFGDPVSNPKAWKVKSLADLGSLDRGVSKHRPRNDPSLLGGSHPLIQTGEVANCDGYIRTYTSTYSDKGLDQSKLWPAGTLCITIAANIAKTGILLFPACFPDSVVGFTASETATVEYVRFWLSFLQKTLEANAPESAQKNINLAILRNLQVPVPPIDLIRKFAAVVSATESIRVAQRKSVQEGLLLSASLQHELLA